MNAKSPLLAASAVHDQRNLPMWVALAFSAGAVNSTALAGCQRFVSHVTGTMTRVGADYDSLRLLVDYGAVLVAFVVGAMTSFWAIDGRRLRGKEPAVAFPLALVSAVLVAVGVAGLMGAFGPFGRTVETTGDFVMLSLLAFAMGLQNASVATMSGMIVRTTHMTGPLTDLSIALAALVSSGIPDDVRETAKKSLKLRGAKVLGFILGAFVAAWFGRRFEYATFFLPATFVAVSAFMLRAAVTHEHRILAGAALGAPR
jgi:uncharacterized membrane protein YoaK (UPF0700 family)